MNRLRALVASATLKDSAVLSLGQIIAAVQGALFFAVTARLFSLTDLGLYSIILATATILKDVVDPSLNALLMRFVPRSKPGSARSVIRLSFLIKGGYFLLIIPAAIVLRDPLSEWLFHGTFAWLLLSTVVLSMTMSYVSSISGILQSHRRFKLDAGVTMLQPLLRLLLLGLVLMTQTLSVSFLLLISVTSYALVALLGTILVWPLLFRAKVSKQTLHSSSQFVSPLVVSTALGAVTDRVSLYAVNTFVSAAEVGLFGYINQLFIPTRQIAGSLSSVFGSRFARFDSKEEAWEYCKKGLGLSGLLALGLATTIPFGSVLIRVIYGPSFEGGGLIFVTLVVGFGLLLIQTPLTAMLLYYFGRSDWMAKMGMVQLLATLAVSWWLVPTLQAFGAALGFLVVMILSTLMVSGLVLSSWRGHKV